MAKKEVSFITKSGKEVKFFREVKKKDGKKEGF